MEKWQRVFIRSNLPELVDLTLCNTALLTRLCANEILSDEEFHEINEIRNPKAKAQKLYEIVVTRKNAYHLLLHACKETKQTGVVSILEDGELNRKPTKSTACISLSQSNTPAEAASRPSSSSDITLPLEAASSITVNALEELNFNNELPKYQKDDFPETEDKFVNMPEPSSSAFLVDQLASPKEGHKNDSSPRSAFQYSQNFSRNSDGKVSDFVENCHIQKSNTKLVGMIASNTDQKVPDSDSFKKVEKTQSVLALTTDYPTNEVAKKDYQFTMEEWQTLNLPLLLKDKQCHKVLLEILVAKKLISDEQRIKIDSTPNPNDKVNFLHKMIVARKNGYQELLEASREVKQSGVSNISEKSEKDLFMESALVECNARGFICESENNIDLSSFQGISSAIANYVDVEKFQLVLETELLFLRGPKNETYLHVAAAYGYVKLINCLIRSGQQISTLDSEGNSPGHYIGKFSTNIIETLKTLTEHGLNLRQRNDNGLTTVSTVVLHGRINKYQFHHLVDHIIKIGYEDLFIRNCKRGATPLHHALEMLDLERDTIDLILRSTKVDINLPDNNGSTLILLALEFGRSLETIKNLILLGADIKRKKQDESGAFHSAVVGGNKEVIQYLISQGLNIHEKNNESNTPLHLVCRTRAKNYFELTKLLLENGADLYSKNEKNGETLAHQMALWKEVSCDDFKVWTTAMIKSGHARLFTIRVEDTRSFFQILFTRRQTGRTPLHCSMERHDLDLETTKLIIESAKLDINQPDDNGVTILHTALEYWRSRDTFKILVELGADWKKKNKDGRGVLHVAVIEGNQEAFLYFKSLGADVNAKDKDGQTPLHCVTSTRNKDFLGMTKFLLENGADLNAKDEYGGTLDQLMSLTWAIGAEERRVWKKGMIKLGHSSLFKNESFLSRLFS